LKVIRGRFGLKAGLRRPVLSWLTIREARVAARLLFVPL
jgi:hypothetical protein